MAEALHDKQRRMQKILGKLARAYPDARIELDFRAPLELLVAVILSAQCTDKRVNLVTPDLFRRFRAAADYAAVTPETLHPFIQSCGLYRNKAKAIVAMAKALVAEHHGDVPVVRAQLNALPGVGAKTAGVVSSHLPGGEAAFPVDTHVGRLARRLGLTRESNPSKVEQALQGLLPEARWGLAHQLLIFHGRRRCSARAPDCARCEVHSECPRRGVKTLAKPGSGRFRLKASL